MARALLSLLAALALFWPSAVLAQEKFPSRPIRIIVPFGPGSATDVTARMVGETMKTQLGQQIVVENKPGAFGIVAIEEMVRAKPDGHTILLQNVSTAALTPQLYKKRFSIDYERDVVVFTRVVELPGFFNISTKHLPDIKTFQDLVAYSKANPGKIRYATTGVGAFTHFEGEMLQAAAGVKWEHIPMKEGPPGFIKGLLSGDVQVAGMTMPSIAGLVQSGQLRPLVTYSDKRLTEYPDIPTIGEAGFPGIITNNWSTMHAHAQTPRPILEALHKAVNNALNDEALKANFKKQVIVGTPSASIEEAQKWLADKIVQWKKTIDKVKIEIEN